MTEEALVRRLKEGDKASFDLLYDKYKNMALHTAYLITGNLSDSEDVVQDTFVKVWLHCRELKNEGGFKAWMMQILVRTAYKCGKKKSRELPDYVLTEEDKAGEARGDFYISVGSQEVEIHQNQTVTWDKDGVRYQLLGFDLNLSADDMFDMAEEIIGIK